MNEWNWLCDGCKWCLFMTEKGWKMVRKHCVKQGSFCSSWAWTENLEMQIARWVRLLVGLLLAGFFPWQQSDYIICCLVLFAMAKVISSINEFLLVLLLVVCSKITEKLVNQAAISWYKAWFWKYGWNVLLPILKQLGHGLLFCWFLDAKNVFIMTENGL